jgi:3-oxoacyl-[acyl-carrier-protein] synthase III
MSSRLGGNLSNLPEVYHNGWHHLTQDFSKVSKLSPDLFEKGLKNMISTTGLGKSQEEREYVKWFLATIPIKHLLDICVKMARKEWKMPQMQFYSNLRTRGYSGPPSTVIALDGLMQEVSLSQGDVIVGFVEESSKWMQAGFILRYCE